MPAAPPDFRLFDFPELDLDSSEVDEVTRAIALAGA
jgi:hypothetical protein